MILTESEARLRKALRLADQLVALGCDSETAPWLPDAAWEGFALLAEVRPPSWRTKEVVVQLLAEREDAQRRMANLSQQLPGISA